MRYRFLAILLVFAAAFIFTFQSGLTGFQAPLTSLDQPDASGIVKLEFGLLAQEPRLWAGKITSSQGEVLSTWGWHFVLPDRIDGVNGWSLTTRLYNGHQARYPHRESLPSGFPVLPNGVYVAVKAPETATLSVTTNNGDFGFRLSELKAAGRMAFLGGDASAVYSPPTRSLTRGESSQHDFPAVATRGEDLFVSWVTFQNEANAVYLARGNKGVWQTYRATPKWGDYATTAVAVDGEGRVHVVWNEYRDDRWRLVSRVLDLATGKWEKVKYVVPSGRRQLFHRMTTDSNGTPWLAWQEFAGGNFDIYAASRSEDGWSEPIRVSDSPASDWHPVIAPASDGTVYIAWDSYDAGNYDIFLRPIRDGRLGPLAFRTESEIFEAHATMAIDPQDRVWLAWEEGGPNWGKDTGVLGTRGEMIRTTRRVRLVRYAAGKLSEPPAPLEKAVPGWMGQLHEGAHLAIGPNGLPYLFFRHHLHRQPMRQHELEMRFGSESRTLQPWYDTTREIWDIWSIGFDGLNWTPVRQLPQSEGRCRMEMGSGIVGGKLVYVWPVDGKTYPDPHVRNAQIRYAEFEPPERPASRDGMRPFVSHKTGVADGAPTEKEDLARVRAFRWEDKEPLRLFRGDLHRHTDISADAIWDGDIYDTYRYAIDAASLDFLGVTDHTGHEKLNYYKYDWWRTRQAATMFNSPGHFAAFFSYERTVTFPGGHRNVISTRRDAQPVPISDEEFYGVESWAERLYPNLRRYGDLCITHTPASGMGTDWREVETDVEPVVEIFQGARGHGEEAVGLGHTYIPQKAGLVWNAWAKGHKLGVIASSDHRSTHQSYAAVYAPELTAEAIHAWIKKRRTFAATDNIIIRYEAVAADGETYKMGEEIRSDRAPELRVEIQGTAPLDRVEIIGNGKILLAREPGTNNDSFSFRDNNPPEGPAFYYVRLRQTDKALAWSSPIWVEP